MIGPPRSSIPNRRFGAPRALYSPSPDFPDRPRNGKPSISDVMALFKSRFVLPKALAGRCRVLTAAGLVRIFFFVPCRNLQLSMSYIDESDLQISANRAVAHVKREVLTCRDLVFANGLDDDALCYTHVVAYPRMLVERPSGVRFLFGFAIGLEINHVQASQQSVAKLCHLTNHFAISEIHPLLARGIGVTKPNPE